VGCWRQMPVTVRACCSKSISTQTPRYLAAVSVLEAAQRKSNIENWAASLLQAETRILLKDARFQKHSLCAL